MESNVMEIKSKLDELESLILRTRNDLAAVYIDIQNLCNDVIKETGVDGILEDDWDYDIAYDEIFVDYIEAEEVEVL